MESLHIDPSLSTIYIHPISLPGLFPQTAYNHRAPLRKETYESLADSTAFIHPNSIGRVCQVSFRKRAYNNRAPLRKETHESLADSPQYATNRIWMYKCCGVWERFIGFFPQRSPIIVGSFAERDLEDASNRIWMYKYCGVDISDLATWSLLCKSPAQTTIYIYRDHDAREYAKKKKKTHNIFFIA